VQASWLGPGGSSASRKSRRRSRQSCSSGWTCWWPGYHTQVRVVVPQVHLLLTEWRREESAYERWVRALSSSLCGYGLTSASDMVTLQRAYTTAAGSR
jgi:hypothetical protein